MNNNKCEPDFCFIMKFCEDYCNDPQDGDTCGECGHFSVDVPSFCSSCKHKPHGNCEQLTMIPKKETTDE